MRITFIWIGLVVLLFSRCGSSSQQSGTAQTNEDSKTNHPKTDSFTLVYHTPVNDTIYTVATHLSITTNKDQISGTYLWVLPFKDGKYGEITGIRTHDTINGHYSYQQEGGNYTDSIQIILQASQAIVRQFNAPGHQLVDTLLRVEE